MMEAHIIDFVELASLGCKLFLLVFVIVVNHVGFIGFSFYISDKNMTCV